VGHGKRSMKNPKSDGRSFNAWFSSIKNNNKYRALGPLNRAFYFTAKGSSADVDSTRYSAYLPWGMAGIGNQRAARVFYQALAFMPSSATYIDYRAACLNSAKLQFGQSSSEYRAVMNAFAGVNVGGRASTYPSLPSLFTETPGDVGGTPGT